MSIRIATLRDAEAISAIYNHYVTESTSTFAIAEETIDDRIQWLAVHDERFPATVYEHDDTVVGWAALSRWNQREAFDRTAEVSFYVHHDFHRRGIGRALFADLIERASTIGHHALVGAVCHEQVASIQLHQSMAFVEVGRLRHAGRKFDRWLDLVYMQRILPEQT